MLLNSSPLFFLCYLSSYLTIISTACRTLSSAQKLSNGFKNTKPISLDVNDSAALDEQLSKVDLVISLIPYTYHATVIKGAIRTKKNVVTTSYVSPAMLELEKDVKEAGITVMNEIGVDPVCLRPKDTCLRYFTVSIVWYS